MPYMPTNSLINGYYQPINDNQSSIRGFDNYTYKKHEFIVFMACADARRRPGV